jgi:branched-chain amino acid transport system ATP-binding protein
MKTADCITVLNFGEVLANGSPDEIRNNPHVQEAYLGTSSDA